MIHWASPGAQYRTHKQAIDAAIARVLKSGTYILGAEVEAFESSFARYCGGAGAVGVASGTDALILALKAFGVGAGHEVVTVAHTALATIAAILATGATPVLVDVDSATGTIDPAGVESAVSPRTKAIVAVHLYGQPAHLDTLGSIAKRRGLKLIEDCAQAVGARYRGRRVGSVGDAGTFSFYPTKNLGAIGDGGMVLVSDEAAATRVRRLRQYGWNDLRETEEVGLNSRLDPLQAAILLAKLPSLDSENVRRQEIGMRYKQGLSGLPLMLPAPEPDVNHAYHLYVVACKQRDELAAYLAKNDIGTAVHYPVPAHRHKGYAERVRLPKGGLPVTDRLAGEILSLPIYPELADADVDRVISAVRGFFGKRD